MMRSESSHCKSFLRVTLQLLTLCLLLSTPPVLALTEIESIDTLKPMPGQTFALLAGNGISSIKTVSQVICEKLGVTMRLNTMKEQMVAIGHVRLTGLLQPLNGPIAPALVNLLLKSCPIHYGH